VTFHKLFEIAGSVILLVLRAKKCKNSFLRHNNDLHRQRQGLTWKKRKKRNDDVDEEDQLDFSFVAVAFVYFCPW
jgi:hypothetical protein